MSNVPRTFVSAADLSAKQNLIAKLDGDGKADLATAATQALIGTISDGGKASGDAVSICHPGMGGYVIAGGTINEGDLLTTDGNSKAVATTTDGDAVLGVALEAGASGDIIRWGPTAQRIYIA